MGYALTVLGAGIEHINSLDSGVPRTKRPETEVESSTCADPLLLISGEVTHLLRLMLSGLHAVMFGRAKGADKVASHSILKLSFGACIEDYFTISRNKPVI